MPYKTKASKIAAAQRRFSYIEARNDGTFSYNDKSESKSVRAEIKSTISIGDKLFLKNDLIKIVIASVVIITLQIGLSLTLF